MANRQLASALALVSLAVGACSSGTGSTSTTPPGGIVFSYTPCTAAAYYQPILVAIQNGTGPWTAVAASGGMYSATLDSTKVGVLEVTGSGGSTDTYVYYALASEVEGFFASSCITTALNASVTVNSLAAGETASVGLGWNSTSTTGPGSKTFTVPATSTTADLLAVLSSGGSAAAKIILRRSANANALAPLDFTTSEAFAPTTPSLSITGTGGEAVTFAEWYQSAGGFRNQVVYGAASPTLPGTYWGIPAANQMAGDLHELFAYTSPAVNGGVTSGRTVDYYGHDPVARTVAFSALPAAPIVTVATTSPYPRFLVQWTLPTGHTYVELYYDSGNHDVGLYATAGYLGGSTVNLEFPDLTSVTGWQSSWVPAAGVLTSWGFYDYAFNMSRPAFYSPTDGFQYQYNYWRATLTP